MVKIIGEKELKTRTLGFVQKNKTTTERLGLKYPGCLGLLQRNHQDWDHPNVQQELATWSR